MRTYLRDSTLALGFPSDNSGILEESRAGVKREIALGLMPALLDSYVLPPPTEFDMTYKTPSHNVGHNYLNYSSPLSFNPMA